MDNLFVRLSEMPDCLKKGGNLCYIIWANQKTESFVYRWLLARAMFDVTRFSRICRSIGRRFKCSVSKLVVTPLSVRAISCKMSLFPTVIALATWNSASHTASSFNATNTRWAVPRDVAKLTAAAEEKHQFIDP